MSKSEKFILFVLCVMTLALFIKEHKHHAGKQTQQGHRNLEFGKKP